MHDRYLECLLDVQTSIRIAVYTLVNGDLLRVEIPSPCSRGLR
jgi:hypothetical protein